MCRPELHLPFTKGFADQSGRNVHVYQENVQIHNGSAFFDGSARIVINRFSNTEFRGDLVIKFRYNEILEGPTANKLQALVTNGDCGSDPSIIIAKMPGYVLLGAKTNRPKSFALPSLVSVYIFMKNALRKCSLNLSQTSPGFSMSAV